MAEVKIKVELRAYERADYVAPDGTGYKLPAATTTTLGGVVVGEGLNVDTQGLLSVNTELIPTLDKVNEEIKKSQDEQDLTILNKYSTKVETGQALDEAKKYAEDVLKNIPLDDELSITSPHAVKNRAIATQFVKVDNEKVDKDLSDIEDVADSSDRKTQYIFIDDNGKDKRTSVSNLLKHGLHTDTSVPATTQAGEFVLVTEGSTKDTNATLKEKLETGEIRAVYPETKADNILETSDKKVFTNEERVKLKGIETGAQVNIIEHVTFNGKEVTPTENKTIVLKDIATLGSDGKVPAAQLPSYVDDIIEGELISEAVFRGTDGTLYTTGSPDLTGKIYVDIKTNKSYRWSGTKFAVVASDLALGETDSTAYAGSKGKQNATDIANIKNGTTTVPKANHANTSTKLDTARDFSLTGDVTAPIVKFNGESNVTLDTNLNLTDNNKGDNAVVSFTVGKDKTYTKTVNNVAHASSSVKLDTPRNISIFGDVYADVVQFDGTGEVALDAYIEKNFNVNNDKIDLTIGETIFPQKTVNNVANAINVSSTIGGKSIVNIFEPNGTTAKQATHAGSAVKLDNSRVIELTQDVLGSAQFDGTANAVIKASLADSGVVAGTYSSVKVDRKGRVTEGKQLVEIGTDGQHKPSESLAIGGLFFEKI